MKDFSDRIDDFCTKKVPWHMKTECGRLGCPRAADEPEALGDPEFPEPEQDEPDPDDYDEDEPEPDDPDDF